MDKGLRRGIIIVFVTNVINLLFSLITNFILPKYLSVDTYAQIKTYQLYLSYVGLLHLGYVDGIYLQYGGRSLGKRLDEKFVTSMSTMRIFEIAVTIICVLIAISVNNNILLYFALTIIPANMNSFFKYLYQATGEFDRYGRILNLSTILNFAINILIVFVFRIDNYIQIILLYVLIQYIIWVLLEVRFRSIHELVRAKTLFSWADLTGNVSLGFFLTVGNLASLLLTSMDRWFVKLLLDSSSFAYYSFAVSVEGFLNIAITPITTTLYNYFCRERDEKKHKSAFQYLIIFSCLLPCAAFPFKLVLQYYLPTYFAANAIIFILFGSKTFNIIVNSLFVNLYKVNRQQKRYFINLVLVLAVGFVLNVVAYFVLRSNEGFAIATLLSSVLWFVISLADFKYLKFSFKEGCFIGVSVTLLIVLGLFVNSIAGFILFVTVDIAAAYVLMRDTTKQLITIAKNRIKNLKGGALT